MSEMVEALKSAADGAFVVDEELRIHIWNRAAEEILGFGYDVVVGKFCYQVLQGTNEEKRLICKVCCQVAKRALKPEPVANYDIHARTYMGDRRWLNMSIITSKMGGNRDEKLIIHLFRDISQRKEDEMFFRRLLETARRYHKIPAELEESRDSHHLIEILTRREREVLTFLVRGFSTREIAESLSISQHTVRNHIQRILQKLQVHSRLEAVTCALKNGFLG